MRHKALHKAGQHLLRGALTAFILFGIAAAYGHIYASQDDPDVPNLRKAWLAILRMEQAIDKVLSKPKIRREKALLSLGEAQAKLHALYLDVGRAGLAPFFPFHTADHISQFALDRVYFLERNSRLSKEVRAAIRGHRTELSAERAKMCRTIKALSDSGDCIATSKSKTKRIRRTRK
jgi:hypothetical protein